MNNALIRKGFLFIAPAIGALHAADTASETADRYFSSESNSWKPDESTQFKTSDTEGMFLLKDYNLSGSTGYKITNADRRVTYGWANGQWKMYMCRIRLKKMPPVKDGAFWQPTPIHRQGRDNIKKLHLK